MERISDDRRIIEGCIRKDAVCQKALYDKYSSKMFGICMRYAKNREDAQDMFQEAFVKLYSSLDKFSFQGSFEGWLRRFFVNFVLNWYRGRNVYRYNVEMEEFYSPVTVNTAMENFTKEDFLNALQRLSDSERMLFNMIEIDNVDVRTVSERTGLAEATIRSMNSRTKKKLIDLLLK